MLPNARQDEHAAAQLELRAAATAATESQRAAVQHAVDGWQSSRAVAAQLRQELEEEAAPGRPTARQLQELRREEAELQARLLREVKQTQTEEVAAVQAIGEVGWS